VRTEWNLVNFMSACDYTPMLTISTTGESMNGPDHYRAAERLLGEAESGWQSSSKAVWCLELAKLHTALAQVAATALNSDGREWAEAAGPQIQPHQPHVVRAEQHLRAQEAL
jgi:hypothetical protein